MELARIVAEQGVTVDKEALAMATRLAKTDLTTELVKEFTELQGEIGGLYARAQGASAAASVAIYEQYLPLSMDGKIPRTVEGQLLAIADKVDTIAGMFGLGMIPSGSKDPFALRRAANGVVKILAEGLLPLGISNLVEGAEVTGPVADLVRRFMRERLSFYLGDVKGHAYDVVNAVLAVEAGDKKISNDVKDALARAEALSSIRNSPDFLALSTAFKRIASILNQASSLGFTHGIVNEALFVTNEEKDLETRSRQLAPEVLRLREEKKYLEALEAIATLRPQVDSFFEAVMVMDPDEILRTNRLRLLRRVLASFSGIADFSEIVVAG